jgi:predicted ABC-type sugar transport system permease subunit
MPDRLAARARAERVLVLVILAAGVLVMLVLGGIGTMGGGVLEMLLLAMLRNGLNLIASYPTSSTCRSG